MTQSRTRRGLIPLCSAFGTAGPAAAIATIGGVISLGGGRGGNCKDSASRQHDRALPTPSVRWFELAKDSQPPRLHQGFFMSLHRGLFVAGTVDSS